MVVNSSSPKVGKRFGYAFVVLAVVVASFIVGGPLVQADQNEGIVPVSSEV